MQEVKLKYAIAIAFSLVSLAASNPQKILLHYSYSAGLFPMSSEILVKDSLVYRLVADRRQDSVPCRTTLLQPAEIRELVRRLDANDLTPTQSDPDYTCEGTRSLLITTDRKTLAIHESCKIKKGTADKSIDSTMDAFSNYLVGILERRNKPCEDGHYFNLRKVDASAKDTKRCAAIGNSISRQELNRAGIGEHLSESMDFPAFPLKFRGDSLSAKGLRGRIFQVGPSCFEIEVTRHASGG